MPNLPETPVPLDVKHYQITRLGGITAKVAELETRGFQARSDLPPTPFALPYKWNDTGVSDRNLQFHLHAWRMLDPYLNGIAKGINASGYYDVVEATIADWVETNLTGQPGRFTWYDMATGIRASKIAFLQRAAANMGRSGLMFDGVATLISEHFVHLMNLRELNKGNHGLFQLWGLKSLASAFPDHPQSQAATAYAIRRMTDLIGRQFGAHGIHTEHSPEYHFFALSSVSNILDAPDWKISEMAFTRSLLEKGATANPWLADPKGYTVAIGDSEEKFRTVDALGSMVNWPHKKQSTTLAAVLDGYGVIKSPPEIPLEESSYLFMNASRHSKAHKHSDCLSFVWQEGGSPILIDSGKYGYQQNELRDYFTSCHAHNTVEVNKTTVHPNMRKPYGSALRVLEAVAGGGWRMEAETFANQDEYGHRRVLVHFPGRRLIVIDTVTPALSGELRENHFALWWHFPSGAQVDLESGRVNMPDGHRQVRISYDLNIPKSQIQLHEGEKSPRLQGWVSPSYLEVVAAPVIGISADGNSVFRAATVFDLGDRRVERSTPVVCYNPRLEEFSLVEDGSVTRLA